MEYTRVTNTHLATSICLIEFNIVQIVK